MMDSMIAVLVNALGQSVNSPGAGAEPPAAPDLTLWDLALKGGPVMVPIALASLVALTIIIERMISLSRTRLIPPGFWDDVTKALEGEGGREKALAYCAKDGSVVATVLEAGIRRLGDSVERVERSIEEAGERAMFRMRRFLRALSLVVAISPMLGLLGTVTGMIKAFQTVAASGEALGRTELLAAGIYEALITTAAGLMVAIPVLVSHHWLSAKIDRVVTEIDGMAMDFVETWGRGGVGGMPEGIPAVEGARRDSRTSIDGDGRKLDGGAAIQLSSRVEPAGAA